MKYPKEFQEKFWSQVKKLPDDGCWEWVGYIGKNGYGSVQARKIDPMPMTTHRISWELHNGPIPKGKHVLHHCDNRACVCPNHLFLGTQRDNNLDRDRKGRVASGDRNGARTQPHRNPFIRNGGSGLRGEKNPMAKLTAAQVRQIRQEYADGTNRHQLAKKYSISDVHADRIVKRTVWKDI